MLASGGLQSDPEGNEGISPTDSGQGTLDNTYLTSACPDTERRNRGFPPPRSVAGDHSPSMRRENMPAPSCGMADTDKGSEERTDTLKLPSTSGWYDETRRVYLPTTHRGDQPNRSRKAAHEGQTYRRDLL